jgi:hypothetical protein
MIDEYFLLYAGDIGRIRARSMADLGSVDRMGITDEIV